MTTVLGPALTDIGNTHWQNQVIRHSAGHATDIMTTVVEPALTDISNTPQVSWWQYWHISNTPQVSWWQCYSQHCKIAPCGMITVFELNWHTISVMMTVLKPAKTGHTPQPQAMPHVSWRQLTQLPISQFFQFFYLKNKLLLLFTMTNITQF